MQINYTNNELGIKKKKYLKNIDHFVYGNLCIWFLITVNYLKFLQLFVIIF